jgi:uncharacterized protein YbjT (DUF2867 family)
MREEADMAGKILVLGSTGTVGSNLVEELARKGERVKAATRMPKQSANEKIEFVKLDLTEPGGMKGAFDDVDRLFVMSPPGYAAADRLLAPLLDFALNKVKRVVTMTASGVEASDEIPLRKVERIVERSGVPWTHLRPTWFMQNFASVWLPGIQANGSIMVPAADAKTAFIDARDVAASAANVLTRDGFTGKAFTLTGGEAFSYKQAAEILTRECGRRIGYVPLDDVSFRTALLTAGMPEDYAKTMVGLFQSVRAGHAARITGDVKALTGEAPRTLVDYARGAKAAFAR